MITMHTHYSLVCYLCEETCEYIKYQFPFYRFYSLWLIQGAVLLVSASLLFFSVVTFELIGVA